MRYPRMIKGLTDTDLYKFNMLQVIFQNHPDLTGEYIFKCRNKDVRFTPEMVEEIDNQITALCNLRFTKEELDYLRGIRFLKPGFIEFLSYWYPRKEHITLKLNEETGELDLRVRGPIFSVMMFEIYLLEIISETYYRDTYDWGELEERFMDTINEKVEKFKDGTYTFKFAAFGCRRRFSYELDEYMLQKFTGETDALIGTSNVMQAMKYHIKPIGTMAHEMFQLYQGVPSIPLAYTTKACLDEWYDVYKGDNGIALTDTLTTDLFLLDFDRSMAATFNGVRNDSGDPYEWGEKMIKHWKKLGIDPHTKTLLFSNSLTLDEAQALYEYFEDKAQVGFGIGGHISTEAPGVEPLNIVIKLQYVDGQPVAKISDDNGKTLCQDKKYIEYLKNAVDFRLRKGF